MHAWRNVASTGSTTVGTETYADTVRCRMRVLASASSELSLMSRASPTCATRFPSRERPEMPNTDAQDLAGRMRSWFRRRAMTLSPMRLDYGHAPPTCFLTEETCGGG